MPGWLKRLEQWAGKGSDGKKRIQTFRLLLIIGLVGVAIMLLNSFVNVKKVDTGGDGREPPVINNLPASYDTDDTTMDSPFAPIELSLETKTREILEKIVGVGAVDVMITVDSTEEVIVQRNIKDTQELTEETDPNGGKRHVTQYTKDGQIVTYESSGNEHPIVTKKIKPKVRGVLIVAKGAENKVVKNLIVDAVQKGLSVPEYNISVVPRKQSQ